MKVPYKHQQRFIDRNKNRDLLVWEGGTGKTFAGALWLKKRKHLKALVVCPKAIIGKWKKDLKDDGAVADVCSRDDIKGKVDINKYKAIILDEAQDFASPIFDKGRSKRTTVIYNYIKNNKDANVLLLTATPVRSTPWNIHTLACFLGQYWDVKDFRKEFFYLTNRFGKLFYEKSKDWRIKIRPYIESIADIVLMKDLVDVPIQHSQVIKIPWTKKQEEILNQEYLEAPAEWVKRHRLENGKEKFKVLQEILNKYRKVLLVCYYREQIDNYVKWIGEDRQVFVLSGSTKDQFKVIQSAQEADDCIFIVQASMGAGFDADQFSVVVFASMSFKYIDYAQMKYRVKRIHNLHENTFIHLIGGKCDKAVYNRINEGKDFDVHEYLAGNNTEDENEERAEDNSESSQMVSRELPW